MRNKIIISTILFLSIIFLGSCEKDKVNIGNSKSDISVKNGILVFKDSEVYNKTYERVLNMASDDFSKWEKELGFVSQKGIFNSIIQAEADWSDKWENHEESELVEVNPHPEIYYQYLNKGFIELKNKGTVDEIYDYSVCLPSVACFINEKGLLVVNDTIFQFTPEYIKTITDGDFSKIAMLDMISETDEKNNIIVDRIFKEDVKSTRVVYARGDSWVSTGTGKKGEKGIGMQFYFQSYLNGSGFTNYAKNEIYVQCEKRNVFKNWVYDLTHTDIEVSWDYRFTFLDGTTESGSNIFRYSGELSNFKYSVNPRSGEPAPYPALFRYVLNGSDPFLFEIRLYNVKCKAVRNGGPSGLYAIPTITYQNY